MLLFFRQLPLAIFIQTQAQNCLRICTGKKSQFYKQLDYKPHFTIWAVWEATPVNENFDKFSKRILLLREFFS